MIGGPTPWFCTNTLAAEIYCPWSRKKVVVRYLTADGDTPIGLIGCSERECQMQCLSGEAPPGSPSRATNTDEGGASDATT
jgi:hypothetical protein